MVNKYAATTPKLLIGLVLDAVGMGLNFIPVLGTLTDVIWGPLTAVYIKLAYGSTGWAVLGLLEEITFLDVIPTCTIAWLAARTK